MCVCFRIETVASSNPNKKKKDNFTGLLFDKELLLQ